MTTEIRGEDWYGGELADVRHEGVRFVEVDLTEASTKGATFEGCTFERCRLNASVHEATAFVGCTFSGTNFFDAKGRVYPSPGYLSGFLIEEPVTRVTVGSGPPSGVSAAVDHRLSPGGRRWLPLQGDQPPWVPKRDHLTARNAERPSRHERRRAFWLSAKMRGVPLSRTSRRGHRSRSAY